MNEIDSQSSIQSKIIRQEKKQEIQPKLKRKFKKQKQSPIKTNPEHKQIVETRDKHIKKKSYFESIIYFQKVNYTHGVMD